MLCATVLEIIASHRGDDDMLELQAANRLGDTLRFVNLQRERFRGRDRAKTAGAGAAFACDHECGRSLAPALPAVRTLRALANCVQAEVGDERLGGEKDRI